MKRVLNFILPAALLFLAAGCQGDLQYEDPIDLPVTHHYEVSFEVPTKTALGGSGDTRPVTWVANDRIFYYTDQKERHDASVRIENSIGYIDLELSGPDDLYLNAFYSGQANASTASNPIRTSPALQDRTFAVAGVAAEEQCIHTFAEAHACAAHLSNLNNSTIHFHSIVSIFKFTLDDSSIKKVVFSAPSQNEVINGGTYGIVSVSLAKDGSLVSVEPGSTYGDNPNSVTIIADSEQEYYFSILPTYLSNGFLLDCYDDANSTTPVKQIAYQNPLVAGIDAQGLLKPSVINLGKTSQWKTTEPPVIVNPVTNLTLSPSSLSFIIGEDGAAQLSAIVNDDADVKTVTWENSNPNAAKVEKLSFSGNTTVFKVTPLAVGNSTLTITTDGLDVNDAPIVKTCVITVTEPAPILPDDLSAEETANCYIAPETGKQFRFRADVKGNSTESISPEAATVLWEARPKKSSTDNTKIVTGDIVTDVYYSNGYITFTAVSYGNALIAAVAGNDILWSWHIWVWPDYDPDLNSQVYIREAGTMMDRNLGSANLFPTGIYDWSTFGLMYQWGRKDPFFGRETHIVALGPGITEVPAPTVSTATTGTIEYTIANPMHFLLYPANNGNDWLYGKRDNTLWGEEKTMYDPCPPGWKLPGKTFWVKNLGSYSMLSYSSLNDLYPGLDFAGIMASGYSHVFYPVQGSWNGTAENCYTTTVYGKTYYGYYWTSGINVSNGGGVQVVLNRTQKTLNPNAAGARASSASVRCMKDLASSSGQGGQGGQEDPGDEPEPPQDPVSVDKVTVSPSSVSVAEGHSVKLTVTVEPDNADNTEVTWSSSNPAIAKVNTEGLVTGVSAGGPVTITATAKDGSGKSGSCAVTVDEASSINLGATTAGTANCYIVSEPGDYCFLPVKGNSDKAADVLSPASAAVLWQSYGTDELISTAVITNVEYSEGMIYFTVPKPIKNGNAVIAAKNANGQILWSWHIWVSDGFDPTETMQVYLERECTGYDDNQNPIIKLTGKVAGTVMDRNLGAFSATPGEVSALGLMYQWGRKDPFLGSSIRHGATQGTQPVAVATGSWPKVYSQISLAYSIENPTTYVCVSNLDWQNTANEALWSGDSKTIYDPCPPGWMVPKGGDKGLWAKSTGITYGNEATYDSVLHGVLYYNFTASTAAPVWVPSAGFITANTGTLGSVGGQLYLWSATPKSVADSRAYALFQSAANTFTVSALTNKAQGCSVRCVTEQ